RHLPDRFNLELFRVPLAAHGHSCCCRGLWLQGVYETRGDSPGRFREIVQLVAGTAPARTRFPQHAAREQVVDVAQRRVWRALGDRRPLAAGELTFKAIE